MKLLRYVFLFVVLIFGLKQQPVLGQRPDAPVYAQPGPYIVGTRDLNVPDAERPLDITIWYPAENPDGQPVETTYQFSVLQITGHALREAPPSTAGAPYPVVLFSHGNAGFRFQSTFLMEHLASYGFVVIAMDHPTNTALDALSGPEEFGNNIAANFIYRPRDIANLLAFTISLNNQDDFAGILNTDKVAITGHSFGGYTALASAGGQLNFGQLAAICQQVENQPELYDSSCFMLDVENVVAQANGLSNPPDEVWEPIVDIDVDAVLLMAPWNGPIFDPTSLSNMLIPTMTLIGTGDTTAPPQRDAYLIYQEMIRAPRTLVALGLAGHYVFVDQCNEQIIALGYFDSCSDPIWDMERAHDLINHYATAFLLSELYGDDEATAELSQTTFPPGVTVYREQGSATAQLLQAERLVPEVLSRIDHDPSAYTQGLLLDGPVMYESAGQYGESTLRRVDPATGEVLNSVPVSEEFFAEGLALVDDRLIQITWKENKAFVYDVDTLEKLGEYSYEGEGWGLCYDGSDLYMSNGSSEITRRDPDTFEPLETYTVAVAGYPIEALNELECVGDSIYANVYQSDYIVRFDKATGEIDAYIDATDLRLPEEISGNVLNGIAYDEANEWFYITGKYWPKMYQVRFVPGS